MKQSVIEEVKEINESNDLYGTYSKAKSICDFLQLEDNINLLEKNNLITIYGPWGSGKSCLMKTIEQQVNKELFETKWFNTWKYEKDNNLPYSLFKFILKDNHKEEFKENAKFAWRTVKNIFKSVAKSSEFNFGIFTFKPGEIIDGAEEQSIKEEEYECLWEQMACFEEEFKKIEFSGKRMIVFLDDLDRCDSENIITLISSIKLLLSGNKNIIFIIGIDKQAVTLALQNKYHNDYNKADEYLEKIFPINFNVANNVQVSNFTEYISDVTELSVEDSKVIIQFFDKIKFNNIRYIKKVLRKYYTIKDYLKSLEYDLNNKYMCVLILYIIILNYFFGDEYKRLLNNDKEGIFHRVVLSFTSQGQIFERWFEQWKIKKCRLEPGDNDSLNYYDLLIFFSSHKLKSNKLNLITYSSQFCIFSFDEFKRLFEDSICNDFLDFVVSNNDMLSFFYEGNAFRKKEIKKITDVLNNIL